MHALAAAVKDHVAVSQGQSAASERFGGDRKRQKSPFGEQRNIGNAGEALVTPKNFQMIQFEPCQPSPEVSGAGYCEVDAYVAKRGRVTVGIAKRKCTAFCHIPCPVAPAEQFLRPVEAS